MAYSEKLAERIRASLSDLRRIEEKKMMGELTFMYRDKMCVGIIKDELTCRIDPEFHEQAISRKGCRTMAFTGRPMIGYVLVNETGMGSKQGLRYWINLALDFNKKAKSSKKRTQKKRKQK